MIQIPIVCKNCGYVGLPKKVLPGNGLIEFILWFCYVVPGLLYSAWRRKSAHNICPVCASKDITFVTSPMGRELVAKVQAATEGVPANNMVQQIVSQQMHQQEVEVAQKRKNDKTVLKFLIIGFIAVLIICAFIQVLSVEKNRNVHIENSVNDPNNTTIKSKPRIAHKKHSEDSE